MKIKTCLLIVEQIFFKKKQRKNIEQTKNKKKKEVENNAFLDDKWVNACSPERMDLDELTYKEFANSFFAECQT